MPDIAPPVRTKGPSRRTSVSAESMDPNKMKGQKVTDIPKTPEVAAELNRIVGKSALLRALDAEQKDKIVRAFDGPKIVAPGENIITQGDIGDTFYLIEDGLVDVYIKKGGGDEMKVRRRSSPPMLPCSLPPTSLIEIRSLTRPLPLLPRPRCTPTSPATRLASWPLCTTPRAPPRAGPRPRPRCGDVACDPLVRVLCVRVCVS